MTTWIPDKMAANQTRTAWIPDVNNEDRCSEKSAEKHKRKLFINYNYVHKIYKIGNNTKYHNCGHIHRFAKYWGQSKKRYKILDRPWTVPRSWKVFWTALLYGGQRLLVYGVAIPRVWTKLKPISYKCNYVLCTSLCIMKYTCDNYTNTYKALNDLHNIHSVWCCLYIMSCITHIVVALKFRIIPPPL